MFLVITVAFGFFAFNTFLFPATGSLYFDATQEVYPAYSVRDTTDEGSRDVNVNLRIRRHADVVNDSEHQSSVISDSRGFRNLLDDTAKTSSFNPEPSTLDQAAKYQTNNSSHHIVAASSAVATSSSAKDNTSGEQEMRKDDWKENSNVEGNVKSANESSYPFNISVIEDEEYHNYYSSRVIISSDDEADDYWLDESIMSNTHSTLSASYRSAATLHLSFPFLFYGHEVKQVTIATGGFLYMSDFLHQWLTATQYIAPLMANFDTKLGNDSHIRYYDNGTVFVVWWKDVILQDYVSAGLFSFQTMLHRDGRIIFSYEKVPPLTDVKISTLRHPVKIGVSDAYYVDKPTNPDMRQRTIYEYHRVEINMSRVASHTAVVINPLITCVSMKTCSQCVNSSALLASRFQCQWCSALRRCSDGLDRLRQEWLEKSCDKKASKAQADCDLNFAEDNVEGSAEYHRGGRWRIMNDPDHVTVEGLICLFLFLTILIVALLWLLYAYRHPNTPSGLWLIQHRPDSLMGLLYRMKECCLIPVNKLRGGDGGRGSEVNAGDRYIVTMQPGADDIIT